MAANEGGSAAAGADWGGVIGALAGGITGIWQQPVAHQWASAANKHAMAFARWMDNTKYRRATRDLAAAGLNPMLAYTSGYHGSSMMGASGQPSSGGSDIASGVAHGVNSARAVREMGSHVGMLRDAALMRKEEVAQSRERTKQEQFATESARSAVFTSAADAVLREEEALMARASREKVLPLHLQLQGALLQLEQARLPSARAMMEFDKSGAGQFLRKLHRGFEAIEPLSGAIGGGIGGFLGGRAGRSSEDVETTEGYDSHGKPTGASVKTRRRR